MQWVESSGGPLVVVPVKDVSSWRGILQIDRDVSDYDLACSVSEEIVCLSAEKAQVLVLGDEPFRTTWFPLEDGGLLIRWVYADREETLINFLEAGEVDKNFKETTFFLSIPGSCVLFDSAEDGTNIQGDSIELDLRPGTYSVKTALIDPSSESRFLIHQLTLSPQ